MSCPTSKVKNKGDEDDGDSSDEEFDTDSESDLSHFSDTEITM